MLLSSIFDLICEVLNLLETWLFIILDLLILGFSALTNPFVLIIFADFWLDVSVSVSRFELLSGVVATLCMRYVDGFLFNEYGFVSW